MALTLALVALIQLVLAAAVVRRFVRARGAERIPACSQPSAIRVSIILPVLNEEARIAAALNAILAEAAATPEIVEVLVVDGGSTDGTPSVVDAFAAQDPRFRLLDASPVPPDAVGKAWGLWQGLKAAHGDWVLTLDADTVISCGLTRALAAFVERRQIDALSIATSQSSPSHLYALLHPAFLTTLVYRFGPPGTITRDPRAVLANGQCFFGAKQALTASDAVQTSLSSICEDITIVRTLVSKGYSVGFFESDVSVTVQMYESARDVWENWPRSLVMRDRYFDTAALGQLAQVAMIQAVPLPLAAVALAFSLPLWFLAVQMGFLALRLGVLFGTRKAYTNASMTFWLSPLCDLPVALRLLEMTFRRRLVWRGRAYVRTKDGGIKAADP